MQKIRRLPLHHAYNVRDLGGYAIDDHHMTAWHMLYRADNLQKLDEHDWKYLKELNIRWIIDLRSKAEAASAPYNSDVQGIHRVSIPFMKELDVIDPLTLKEKGKDDMLSSMKLDYVDMISNVPDSVALAMEVIATALKKHEAVLFHCSAGKDRTGILSALLLDLCGVSEFDILADYQVSCTYNTLGINQIVPAEYMSNPVVKALFESTPDMMKPLLELLHKDGCESYLLQTGTKPEHLKDIRSSFIKEN